MMTKPATHTSSPMKKLSDGTAFTSWGSSPIPSPPTTTVDRPQHPLLTRPPSYHKTPSHDHSPVSSATTPTTQMPYAPLLSRTSHQLRNYSTVMQEHQSTQRVMSPDLRPAQDSLLYDKKQGHTTPTKSWKNAPIVKALLTQLLTAPLSSRGQDHQRHRSEQSLSGYLPSLRKT